MIAARTIAAASPVAKLSPDQVAQPIRMVEKPLLEDLLVQTCPVEADRFRTLDIGDQFGVRGSGHHRFWPVSLIENQPLEDRLAVDLYLLAIDSDGAQS